MNGQAPKPGIRPAPVRSAVSVIGIAAGAALLAAVGVTAAGFSAGFSGALSSSGSIDIAQSADGTAQHATPDDANILESDGRPVRALAAPPTPGSWPSIGTTQSTLTVYNTSDSALVDLTVRPHLPESHASAEEELVFRALWFGITIDDQPIGDLISGATLLDDPIVLPAGTGVAPGGSFTFAVNTWLAHDAPQQAWSAEAVLGMHVLGETVAGEPIQLFGEKK